MERKLLAKGKTRDKDVIYFIYNIKKTKIA
jgi:hypothetical protein